MVHTLQSDETAWVALGQLVTRRLLSDARRVQLGWKQDGTYVRVLSSVRAGLKVDSCLQT